VSESEAAAEPQAVPGPGAMLRMAREARGIGDAEVAAALKMSPRQIEAIESGGFFAAARRHLRARSRRRRIPVVVQSMTNTDTADVATAMQVEARSSPAPAPRSCASR
jgi:hypothetical protein